MASIIDGLSTKEAAIIYLNHSGFIVQSIPTSCD